MHQASFAGKTASIVKRGALIHVQPDAIKCQLSMKLLHVDHCSITRTAMHKGVGQSSQVACYEPPLTLRCLVHHSCAAGCVKSG